MQRQMLGHVSQLLKPNGKLVYCTCSLLREEGEDQIKWLLSETDEYEILPPTAPGLEADWISPGGGVRLRPDYWSDIGGMDGFYMAVLRRKGGTLPG